MNVLWLQSILSLDQCVDTVDHVLDKFLLGATEAPSVRNIVRAVIGLRVLAVDASDLDVVPVSDRLHLTLISAEFWQSNVHGGTHRSAEVGRATGDVAQMLIMSEGKCLLDVGGSTAEAVEDLLNASTRLHGDDTKLVFFIDPDEERLGVIVENASTGRPVAVQITGLQESIALLEKEMVVNQ